ncbi:RSM28 (YDR494W) [Zygosaccharomyces parabailii]|nr:RSM28 (YDR494W) [Zygosaccharomyces parabailii]CDH12920.1 uncharacterized protein ZBAI_04706 [Zygosaccharomyces bailii ISA1307]
MIRKVFRASYSTDVTQEFLQNILARAQEASAKKLSGASTPNRKRWDNSRKSNQRRPSKVTPRVKSTSSASVVTKQPQFKKRSNTAVKSTSEEVDLMEALSESKSRPRRGPNLRKSKREVPGMTKKTMVKVDAKPFVINQTHSTNYRPQEPTPLSLMKFHSGLCNTGASRLLDYSLKAMKTANFPLNRFPNQGFYDRVQAPPKHVAVSLQTSIFGKYMPYHGLIFKREKFLSELSIGCETSQLEATVFGKYQKLEPQTKKAFTNIAKSDKKINELAKNSEVVRKSLESNSLDPVIKKNLYDVCSGVKPISELTQ